MRAPLSRKPFGAKQGATVGVLAAALLVSLTSAGAAESRVEAAFPSEGITRVVLRASAVERASVVRSKAGGIKVSGIPTGGTRGYHPSDPNWKETTASEWGLGFVAKRFGSTLVISTKNEIQYIHHHYTLEGIRVKVHAGVAVVREPRTLGPDGAPDLRSP